MLRALARVLLGFAAACLAAGVTQVAFVTSLAELRAAGSELTAGRFAPTIMLVLLTATHSAIFAAPFAFIAAAIGEWLSVRSWIFYALAGVVVALGGFFALYTSEVAGEPTIFNDYALKAYLTTGFCGGFVYWLFSGRNAGAPLAPRPPAATDKPVGRDNPKAED